jgi:hypothetical protein
MMRAKKKWIIALLTLPSVSRAFVDDVSGRRPGRAAVGRAMMPPQSENAAGPPRDTTSARRILGGCGSTTATSAVRGRRGSRRVIAASSTTTTTSSSSSSSSESNGAAADPTTTSTTEAKAAHRIELHSVDVRYDRRSELTYVASTGRYLDILDVESSSSSSLSSSSSSLSSRRDWGRFLHSAFVPEGVSSSYYDYVRWRILQRFVNANVHVIGTQSLLMGLRGMQQQGRVIVAAGATATATTTALGAAAATNWVLKDTLGKVVRMAWASRMGRKFDPDAKRWRFRASLIYAIGNGLEVCTYLHPRYFLALAMLANSCKQMSMLTSSATRNAIYNSFRRIDNEMPSSSSSSSSSGGIVANSAAVAGPNGIISGTATSAIGNAGRRGSGGVENIGDITAKGEAQIAVVDLLGIFSGICLSSEYTHAHIINKAKVTFLFFFLWIDRIVCHRNRLILDLNDLE